MPKNNFFEEPQENSTDQKILLPKHHGWIWILSGIVILALATAAFLFTHRNKADDKPVVSDFASCKAAGGQIMESFPEQCRANNQTFTNPDQKVVEKPKPEEPVVVQPKLLAYSDTANKFGFSYPEYLVQTEADVATPYTANPVDVTSQIFTHTIPMQYCNLKGDCVPNTTDFSISFTVVNSSVATISSSPNMTGIADVTFGANKFKCLTQGVEGEGIVYCFISLPSGKTLMVSRKFIDENVLAGYKNAKDFIKKADQDKLAAQIMGSLTLTK